MGKGHWNPWAGADELRQRMDRLLEEALRDMSLNAPAGAGYRWSPQADVYETPQALVARLDVPGVSAEQLVLEWSDGELLVRGERPADCLADVQGSESPEYAAREYAAQECEAQESSEATGTAFLVMERAHGPFVRRFPLPHDADPEGIAATLKDGVLTIIVPRRPRKFQAPRRVTIG